MEVVALLSQGRTAAAQCGLFINKSVPVIFEPPCSKDLIMSTIYELYFYTVASGLLVFPFLGVRIIS